MMFLKKIKKIFKFLFKTIDQIQRVRAKQPYVNFIIAFTAVNSFEVITLWVGQSEKNTNDSLPTFCRLKFSTGPFRVFDKFFI